MKSPERFFYPALVGMAFLVFGLRWFLFAHTQFIADDAYITYRYAENWIHGNGLVYNPGEKVLGTTTPLLTLLISAGLWLGIPARIFSPVLNMFCDALAAALIVLLFRRQWRKTSAGFLAAFFYAVFPSPWIWSISGMEVSLYALCIVASLFFFISRRFGWSFFFLGCALLTRIDALVLLVALVMTALLAREKLGWKPWVILLCVVAPWLIAATLYYGSPIPNSLVAKKVFYGQLAQFRSSPLEIVSGFVFGGKTSLVSAFYSPLVMSSFGALFLFAALGTIQLLRDEKRLWALPLWAGGYVTFFIVGKTHMHPWYFAPFYAVYLPLAALGIAAAWEWIRKKCVPARLQKAVQAATAAVLVAATAVGIRLESRMLVQLLGEYQKTENFLTQIAFWVRDRSSPGDKIYYSDIGKVGYFTGRYILDPVGIVSPVVTKHYRAGNWIGPIREVKPEFVVFAETDFRLPDFLSDPELKKLYAETNRFDFKKSSQYSSAVYSSTASGVEFPVIIVYQKRS